MEICSEELGDSGNSGNSGDHRSVESRTDETVKVACIRTLTADNRKSRLGGVVRPGGGKARWGGTDILYL